jgi:hypothetical protein
MCRTDLFAYDVAFYTVVYQDQCKTMQHKPPSGAIGLTLAINSLLLELIVSRANFEYCYHESNSDYPRMDELGFVPGTTHQCYKSNIVRFTVTNT